jgi:hypothetical protein
MPPPLLLVNSIGLTGAEILSAELAAHPQLAMLPGQNFIGLKNCLYRQQDYAALSGGALYDELAAEYFMTGGRMWSGLAKDMTPAQRGARDGASHRARFAARAQPSASLLDHARVFAETYFEGRDARYLGFFGQNLVLSHGRELAQRHDCRVLGCENGIALWLATISQRMTWDCSAAAKFWLVNHLLLADFAQRGGRYLGVDLERLVDARADTMAEVRRFLDIDGAAPAEPVAGFIRFDPAIFARLRADAALIDRIYGGTAVLRIGREFARWSPGFLADDGNRRLLERYRDYWNSTSHTNFDWIGPVEEEIWERVREFCGYRDERSLAFDFYHRYYRLDSLNHASPRALEPQMLGCLEAEIPVPRMPYFLKICIEHLSELARIAERQAHSYRSLRESLLYRSLAEPDARLAIQRLGLADRAAALEALIDRAEEMVGLAGARRAPGA